MPSNTEKRAHNKRSLEVSSPRGKWAKVYPANLLANAAPPRDPPRIPVALRCAWACLTRPGVPALRASLLTDHIALIIKALQPHNTRARPDLSARCGTARNFKVAGKVTSETDYGNTPHSI